MKRLLVSSLLIRNRAVGWGHSQSPLNDQSGSRTGIVHTPHNQQDATHLVAVSAGGTVVAVEVDPVFG